MVGGELARTSDACAGLSRMNSTMLTRWRAILPSRPPRRCFTHSSSSLGSRYGLLTSGSFLYVTMTFSRSAISWSSGTTASVARLRNSSPRTEASVRRGPGYVTFAAVIVSAATRTGSLSASISPRLSTATSVGVEGRALPPDARAVISAWNADSSVSLSRLLCSWILGSRLGLIGRTSLPDRTAVTQTREVACTRARSAASKTS